MNYTTHKKIQKPISIEKYNVGVFNTNADIIDSELNKHDIKDNALEKSINNEVTRAKKAESDETTRATNAESNLDSKKIDKTTVATPSTLGLVKSGTDITVDSSGNVSVNDNSHKHTVSNISDLTANASELNVLDGITASTAELNYTDGVTSNIQTQLDSKVDKVSGKGLSTNDYTTAEKNKLSGIATGANNYSLPLMTSSVRGGAKIGYSQNGKNYPVQLSNEQMYVNVPWTDTNTTYGVSTQSANGLMNASDKIKLDYTNVAYCTCSTAATTAAKVATINGNSKFVLQKGAIAIIKFTITNTASSCTLNVGNTGAKNIWYNTGQYTGNSNQICGYANRTSMYVYDGTYWVWVSGGFDANSTYNPMTLGGGYGTCLTAAATVAKVATLSGYNLINGGIVAVKFTYAVPASATLNINSKGAKAIYYRGSAITANLIQAGDIVTFIYNGSQYHVIAVDRSLTSSNGGTQVVYQSSEPTSNLASGMIWIG